MPEYLDEEAVTEALVEAALAAALPEPEARATVGSGLRAGMADPETLVEPSPLPPTLPTGFWQSRESLRHIRQAARSEAFPADALFGAVWPGCRGRPITAACCPVPGWARSTFRCASSGESGDGKGTALDLSSRLVPDVELATCLCGDPDHDGMYVEVPAGTGEGITAAFYEQAVEKDPDGKTARRHKLDRRHVLIRMDEVQALTALQDRSGATIVPLLRQAFSGEGLGFQYSSSEKRRKVPAREYRLAVVMGVQPTLAAPLFDEVGGGTPQRLLWLSLMDPSLADLLDEAPPGWPGLLVGQDDDDTDGGAYDFDSAMRAPDPGFATSAEGTMSVAHEVLAEINGRLVRRRAGQLRISALDTHRDLLRLKVAAFWPVSTGSAPTSPPRTGGWPAWSWTPRTACGSGPSTGSRPSSARPAASASRPRCSVNGPLPRTPTPSNASPTSSHARSAKVDQAKRRDLRDAVGKRDREYLDPAIERAVSQRLIVEDDNGGYLPGETKPPEGAA